VWETGLSNQTWKGFGRYANFQLQKTNEHYSECSDCLCAMWSGFLNSLTVFIYFEKCSVVQWWSRNRDTLRKARNALDALAYAPLTIPRPS